MRINSLKDWLSTYFWGVGGVVLAVVLILIFGVSVGHILKRFEPRPSTIIIHGGGLDTVFFRAPSVKPDIVLELPPSDGVYAFWVDGDGRFQWAGLSDTLVWVGDTLIHPAFKDGSPYQAKQDDDSPYQERR